MLTSVMHTHSRCGNHSDWCEYAPNYLKGLRLSECAKESEREKLCVIRVARCGGVMLQVAAD